MQNIKPYTFFPMLSTFIQSYNINHTKSYLASAAEQFVVQVYHPGDNLREIEDYGMKLLYVLRGTLSIQINQGEVHPIDEGCLLMIDKHTRHAAVRWSEDCLLVETVLYSKYLRISLIGQLYSVDRITSFIFAALNGEMKSSFFYIFETGRIPQIGMLICYLLEETMLRDTSFQDMCKSLLAELMIELDRILVHKPALFLSAKNKDKPVYRILNYVVEHHALVTLDELSDVFGYTPNHISHMLQEVYGRSFQQFLHEIRVIDASRLLANTSMPISAVCTSVGYSNTSFFYKLFSRYYGITPMQYRRLAREGKPIPTVNTLESPRGK